jgi:hypothetical protein
VRDVYDLRPHFFRRNISLAPFRDETLHNIEPGIFRGNVASFLIE